MFIPKKVAWAMAALLLICAGVLAVKFLWPKMFGKEEVSRDAALESFPVLIRTNGGLLEVATVHYRKTYWLKIAIVVAGMKLPFCAEEASITINPHVTYRVRLAERWKTDYHNKTLYVKVPALEPALPVAFETSHIKDQLTGCWFMMSLDTRNDLLRSLSATLAREAKAPFLIDFAREHGARDTAREFVQTWLLAQKDYDLPANTPVEVEFAGE